MTTNQKLRSVLWLVSLALVLAPHGARGAEIPSECMPDSLLVSQHASDVKYGRTFSVGYVVHEKYPCPNLLKELTEKLAIQGWTPRDHDPMNPEHKNPSLHEWATHFELPQVEVDQWFGWFENAAGDRLGLALRYHDRRSGGDGETKVEVLVSYQQTVASDAGQ
jgi:hypothetical protein